MTIPSKSGFNWATGSRQDGFYGHNKLNKENMRKNHHDICSWKSDIWQSINKTTVKKDDFDCIEA
jgi:hypothetical protein